jgi:hypothetical protein
VVLSKSYIEKELLTTQGRLKRKKIKELNIPEELVYIKFYEIEKPKCEICENKAKFKCFSKGFGKFCSKECQNIGAKKYSNDKLSDIPLEKITKEFIKDEVLNKNGNLNANISRFLPCSNEELFIIYHNIQKPKCKNINCNNFCNFKKFSEGYYDFCSVKCAQLNDKVRQKQEDTLERKYGMKDPLSIKDGRKRGNAIISSKEFIEKRMDRSLKDFGYKTSFGKKETQDKIKETFVKKYGVENPMFSADFIRDSFIPTLNEKRIQTYLAIYGETHPMKNKDILEKMKETNEKKYGVPFVSQLNSVQAKIRTTNERNGNWITEEQVKSFRDYSRLVWRYTNQNDLSVLENIEKRAHTKEGYHLDHKYSIYQGFKDNIPAKVIGCINNLEMLPSGQNLSKNRKCSVTKEEILSYI